MLPRRRGSSTEAVQFGLSSTSSYRPRQRQTTSNSAASQLSPVSYNFPPLTRLARPFDRFKLADRGAVRETLLADSEVTKAIRSSRVVLNLFYKVSAEYASERPVDLPRDSIVIYLMNHRSNADYVLVGYVLSGRVAISYAVGE